MNAAPENKDAVVRTIGLTRIFRDFWQRPKVCAVKDLNLEIRRGEIFGLLGPNGSGKSTTIKMLLGLLRPTAGEIRVFDKPPRNVAAKKDIGYLPEESYLYHYLSPQETLMFYGRLFNLGGRELKERTEQLLSMVGLLHVRNRPTGEFSKGMARRVGLAQALINNPSLVILDEPTSGLDPIGCRQVKDLILALSRQGKTILLSSHLLADVQDVCDRIAILFNGQVRAEGRVRDLLEQKEQVRFTLPNLTPDRIARINSMLATEAGAPAELDHPSINLEKFFMNVVEQAHRDTPSPSGADRATGIASFLSAGNNRSPAE